MGRNDGQRHTCGGGGEAQEQLHVGVGEQADAVRHAGPQGLGLGERDGPQRGQGGACRTPSGVGGTAAPKTSGEPVGAEAARLPTPVRKPNLIHDVLAPGLFRSV